MERELEAAEFRATFSRTVQEVMELLANKRTFRLRELYAALNAPEPQRKNKLIRPRKDWENIQRTIKRYTSEEDYQIIKDELRGLTIHWFFRVICDSDVE